MLTLKPSILVRLCVFSQDDQASQLLWGQQAMKKLAVASLGLALWMGGAAHAQSPFFQPTAQPIEPVAATAPATPQPLPGSVIPVRVHFGGALTKDGVMPVPLYLNQPAGPVSYAPSQATALRVQGSDLGPNIRQVSGQAGAKGATVVVSEDNYAPEVTDPRFVAPHADDMRRPERGPIGYRGYASAEYLQYLSVRQQKSPPLLLVDGVPVTANDIDVHDRLGGRFTLGRWLENTHTPWAIEGTFSFFGSRRTRHDFASNGVTVLEHPFIDADTGLPDSLPVAIDNSLAPRAGVSQIETASRMFGYEVNLRRELCRTSHGHLDLLAGYRQFHLDEGISIRDRVVYNTAPVPLSDATVTSFDEFGTHNLLLAGQVGFEVEYGWRGFFIDGWGKFALGGNKEVINISGATQVRPTPGRTPPPDTLNGKNFAGALFAQPSNIGRYEDWQFTVMPEVGVNVGYAFTSNVRLSAGYHFLFLNNVVRPGDAIDTTITRNQIPQLQPLAQAAGSRPAPPTLVESSYWAHGIAAQIEFRY